VALSSVQVSITLVAVAVAARLVGEASGTVAFTGVVKLEVV